MGALGGPPFPNYMANISEALRADMSLLGLDKFFAGAFHGNRPRELTPIPDEPEEIGDAQGNISVTVTNTTGATQSVMASFIQGATQSFQIGGTQQQQEEDVDMAIHRDRANIVASVTVQDFMRQTLKVTDEPVKNRFLVHIGRLTFPVAYDQLCAETDRLLTVDPAQPGADSSDTFSYNDDGTMVMLAPQDKRKEVADEKAAALAIARAELAKPLQVKRAIIEKGYESKT